MAEEDIGERSVLEEKEELKIPVVHCPFCMKDVPAYIKEFQFDGEEFFDVGEDDIFEAVICPICVNVLNFEGDISVEYYSVDDISSIIDFEVLTDGK